MKLSLIACSFAAGVSAHTIWTQLHVNGVAQGQTKGIRVPTYDGPITDVTSNDVICNGGPNPLRTPLPKDIITVKAGDKLTAEWHHKLDSNQASDAQDPIDKGHLGPVMVYMAKVDDALITKVTGLKWFKIYEDGMDAKGEWAVTRLYNNEGKVDFTLPSCIQSGQYLMRAEIIALHGAGNYPGAQLYPHPLLAQVPLTVSPFVSLPTATPLPYTYKQLPSTLPPSILSAPTSNQSQLNTQDPTQQSQQPHQQPAYVTSASGTSAHPDAILSSCLALQSHLQQLESNAKATLNAWDERRRAADLAEKRRVAPGWLDGDVKLLKPENVDEKTQEQMQGVEGGVRVQSEQQQSHSVGIKGLVERRDGVPDPREGEQLDRAFGGLDIK